jgi:HSP20 family molecular chaperone IbpA
MIVRHRYPAATIDRSFDRVFEQLTNSFFDTRRQVGPTVAGMWNDDEYMLTIDLPGVPADAVSVEVTGSTLLLSAATDTMQWQRSLELGGRLDPDKVTASHVDGRLTVRIGSFDEPEPRRVQIETSPSQAAIEVTSDESSTDEPTNDN